MNRKSAVLSTLLLGGMVLLSTLPVWTRGETVSALGPHVAVEVAGNQAAPGVLGAGLALLAAGVAGGLVGRFGRWIVIAVILFGSCVVIGSSISVIVDPGRPTFAAAAKQMGVAELVSAPLGTIWPWASVLLGCAGLVLCFSLLRSKSAWSRVSQRHERSQPPAEKGPDVGMRTAQGTESERAADSSVPDYADLWDAQTRGEED